MEVNDKIRLLFLFVSFEIINCRVELLVSWDFICFSDCIFLFQRFSSGACKWTFHLSASSSGWASCSSSVDSSRLTPWLCPWAHSTLFWRGSGGQDQQRSAAAVLSTHWHDVLRGSLYFIKLSFYPSCDDTFLWPFPAGCTTSVPWLLGACCSVVSPFSCTHVTSSYWFYSFHFLYFL